MALQTLVKIDGGWCWFINFRIDSCFKKGNDFKNDLSLINKKNYIEFKKLINYLRTISDTKIGIQISHSGRKGSSKIPWIKSNSPLNKKSGWKTVGPSKIKVIKNGHILKK